MASSLTRRQSGRMEEKILACFTWPHIMTSVMPSCFRMSISLLSWPREIQWQRGGQRFDFRRGFLLDGDDGDVVAEAPRAFEREQREAAVAGDEAVAHLLHDARVRRLRMNSSSSSTSGAGRHFGADPLDGLRWYSAWPGEQAEGGLQRFDRRLGKAAPLQADAVGAEDRRSPAW